MTKHTPEERYAEWLRAEISRAGLNYAEFARRVGCKRAYISQLVNSAQRTDGKKPRHPSAAMAGRIGEELGYGEDYGLVKAGYSPEGAAVVTFDKNGKPLVVTPDGQIGTGHEIEDVVRSIEESLQRIEDLQGDKKLLENVLKNLHKIRR